jgi:hypothetical protein
MSTFYRAERALVRAAPRRAANWAATIVRPV